MELEMSPGKFCLWLKICFSTQGFADRRGGRKRGQGKKQEIRLQIYLALQRQGRSAAIAVPEQGSVSLCR